MPTANITKAAASRSTGAARNLAPLLSAFDRVTTFYDLYGFSDRHRDEGANELEARLAQRLSNRHFIAYVQQYEFEALLFAQPKAAERVFGSPSLRDAIPGRRMDS